MATGTNRVAHGLHSLLGAPNGRKFGGATVAGLACILLAGQTGHAQTSAQSLTIGAAVDTAAHKYPAVLEAAAKAASAAEAVGEAQAAYLPRLDAVWQLNRATRNNVFGLLLPQSVVPSISGPVGFDSGDSAWGSAAGLLFSYEVFDYGRRAASVNASRAVATTAEALSASARLEAGVAAADAFLSALGADQATGAARANVARLEVLQRAVKSLVDAELRPGADQSRIEAELAAARNRLISAEQVAAAGRLRLSALLGSPGSDLALDGGPMLRRDPGQSPAPAPSETSIPAVRAAEAAEHVAEANLSVTAKLYRPKVTFQAAAAARASGANANGAIDNSKGLWPNTPNWAAGVTITFPLFDLAANHARARAQTSDVAAAHARYDAAVQRARTETLQAQVLLDAATRISANIPAQLAAAQQAETQARARYDAGLTGISEVADAQRLLAQAEADGALVSLALWRARLAQAAATGDLSAFLADAASPAAPGTPR
jgi:outer membrane protein TolC